MFSLSMVLTAISYVFLAMGLYDIGRRRGISSPWLAWVPVANNWLLGCVSDQYRYVNRGISSQRRTLLVALPVVETVLVIVAFFQGAFEMLLSAEGAGALNGTGTAILTMLLVVQVAHFVLKQLAYYDVHRSCDPANAKQLLVLGMFIPCFRSVTVYLGRGKELGMPPRRGHTDTR